MVGKDLALKYCKRKVKSKPAKMGVESVFGNDSAVMTLESDRKKGVQMKRKGVSKLPKGSIIGDVVMNGITIDDTEEKLKDAPKKQRRGAGGVVAEESLLTPETSGCMLRPRKYGASFRKVELKESDLKKIVGKRVKIYWGGSRRWFAGWIKSFDNRRKLHRILYDDGDKEDLDLMKERIELEVMKSEAFSLCSNIKKESSDGGEVSQEVKKHSSVDMDDLVPVKNYSKVSRNEKVKTRINAKFKPHKEKSLKFMAADMERDGMVNLLHKNSKNQVIDDDVKVVPYEDDLGGDKKRQGVLSSRLRPRKSVPHFQKVDVNEQDLDRIVGKRVKVYWSGSRRWFAGRIVSFDKKRKLHKVIYDDGDKEDLDLKRERIELEIMDTEDFNLCSTSGSSQEKKVSPKSESKFANKARFKLRAGNTTKEKTEVMANDIKIDARPQNSKDQVISIKFGKGKRKSITREEGNVGTPPKKPRREIPKRLPSTPNLCSSKLRPRKLLPSFRKVELTDKDFVSIVGRRVKIYWSGSRRWFVGQIKSYNSKKKLHTVLYDDGDKEELDLKGERFELEVMGDEAFNICSKSGRKVDVKEDPDVGAKVSKEIKILKRRQKRLSELMMIR
ncbi:hypothetical protein ACHQM5_019004 [Ranunculus cassubicifolius]